MDKKEAVSKLEAEINELKRQLQEKENQLIHLKKENLQNPYCEQLTSEEICRYSRQIIIPEVAVKGQIVLKNSKVLVVGAGGLGCPASLYLAAAGVGNITIVDSDNVELSNLHRQILHSQIYLDLPKSQSAKESLRRINSSININAICMHLNKSNVLNLLEEFDVVIDGTDNVATRYLLNDACVLQNKPLVSGSALQFEGQLTVYNYKGGPCYRCLFPKPPPPETVTSCGDGGVLGVVPGCIGILQALETLKILIGMPDVLSGRLLLFDGSNTMFRNVLLRKRNQSCAVCGDEPTVTEPIDYEQFCQANAHDRGDMISIVTPEERITAHEYDNTVKKNIKHVLIDVRSALEFEMCHLPNSVNIPFTDIQKKSHLAKIKNLNESNDLIYVVCRRGNDSQRAVQMFREEFKGMPLIFKDIVGGLHAYSALVDSRFPVY